MDALNIRREGRKRIVKEEQSGNAVFAILQVLGKNDFCDQLSLASWLSSLLQSLIDEQIAELESLGYITLEDGRLL